MEEFIYGMMDFNVMVDGRCCKRFSCSASPRWISRRILLTSNRPTVRSANLRYPQPPFVFPITPPSTAGLETLAARDHTDDESQRDSLWTAKSPLASPLRDTTEHRQPPQPPVTDLEHNHKRAFAHADLDEQHASPLGSDIGAFRIIIERPGTDRPKTTEGRPNLIPTLEVPIPSWRLGTPRFSTRGTAFLRGSSYAPTEDIRSSVFSFNDTSRESSVHGLNTLHVSKRAARRHSHASPQPRSLHVNSSNVPDTPPLPSPMAAAMRPRVIEPSMFDELTFKPACDDRALVRYSTQNGSITAATPARLVAEITSQTFLDYDLLSDFFLTYRSFLAPCDLLAMLVSRLRWALHRNDEIGMVVRVRTFVALRHWILNYFMDDFVVDYDLRKTFCNLINTFVEEILQLADAEKNQVKILGELKKCWRRTCALYWDGLDLSVSAKQDSPIFPGGIAGSRDPDLTPDNLAARPDSGPPRLDNIFDHDNTTRESYNFFADMSCAEPVDPVRPYVRPESDIITEQLATPQSPTSLMSEEAISCSFPSRSKAGRLETSTRGPHPVPARSSPGTVVPLLYSKSVSTNRRPTHAHKRSGSFSDSLRLKAGHGDVSVLAAIQQSTDLLMSVPYAGSLVRGNLFPPGQAFVEVIAPATPAEALRATTYFQKQDIISQRPSAMSAPGMKKLLGSVRRALGSKGNAVMSSCASPTQGAFPSITPLGPQGASVRLPGTAVVPQVRAQRTPLRIDLLGAGIAEDFKQAVREDAEAEADERDRCNSGSIGLAFGAHDLYPSVDGEASNAETSYRNRAPLSGITGGSKSIVIFDDTLQNPGTIMAGVLGVNPSTDTFTDPYMARAGGPTPPSTPPEQQIGQPRRSSHLLGQPRVMGNRSLSLERTPSLVHDLQEPSLTEQSPSYPRQLPSRPSVHSFGRSKRSVSLRRYASFHSGFTRHMTERSFDATTFSGSADRDSSDLSPAPLHTLRRRPGGNLRAVNNAGDLNPSMLRRARSIGSLDEYSDSARSSYGPGEDRAQSFRPLSNNTYSSMNPRKFSLGILAGPSAKRPVSLFSTHSSQPPMRPSFEKEAAKLAQIPDDVDDDGGVESALLKLEGKYDETRRSRNSDLNEEGHESKDLSNLEHHQAETISVPEIGTSTRQHRREDFLGNSFAPVAVSKPEVYRPQQLSGVGKDLKLAVYQPRYAQLSTETSDAKRVAESYSSIPLLQRSSSYDGVTHESSMAWGGASVLKDASEERCANAEVASISSHSSYELILETESLKNLKATKNVKHESREESFLESDSDGGSDLSSEMSMDAIPGSEHLPKLTFPPMAGAVLTELALPPGPLQTSPTNSITMGQALSLEPKLQSPQLYFEQLRQGGPDKALPPTPQITPTMTKAARDGHWGPEEQALPSLATVQPMQASRQNSVHLPFILAFDSQVLAQQFTLVEKDALNEIDWKELIDMRWQTNISKSRSWVDFLRTQDARGVEVVISRFNIVCKWAISEIVLTRNIEERVRCIIKYIHIAAHCRAYRNYATLYQIIVALTSTEVSRLKTTWSYVSAADKTTFKELETLVQPMRNFHNLRAEMEGSGVDSGCIPFIGVYTHDLLFNSQRPSVIAGTPTSEPLVNFERCRTSATIVKNLLRLLEASQLYTFRPVEGVTERCLWMAALGDEEIRRLGDGIE